MEDISYEGFFSKSSLYNARRHHVFSCSVIFSALLILTLLSFLYMFDGYPLIGTISLLISLFITIPFISCRFDEEGPVFILWPVYFSSFLIMGATILLILGVLSLDFFIVKSNTFGLAFLFMGVAPILILTPAVFVVDNIMNIARVYVKHIMDGNEVTSQITRRGYFIGENGPRGLLASIVLFIWQGTHLLKVKE